GTHVPAVEARLIGPDGSERMIRLWPAAEPGAFEGRSFAPGSGRYDVRASLSGKAAADAALIVADDVVHSQAGAGGTLGSIAESSGGVVVTPAELDRLASHLQGLQRPETVVAIHPMRSAWWMVPFAGALSAAWALGRRRGLP